MKFYFMSILALLGLGSSAQNTRKAKELFRAGDFERSKTLYTVILEKKSDDYNALFYLGYIALLENDLAEAETRLMQVEMIKPRKSVINALLGEVYYRKKDFKSAAQRFGIIGRTSVARKLALFDGLTPYETPISFDRVSIPFIVTDPLPFVRVIINGQYSGNFIIDTGGGELVLDSSFAEEVGATITGKEQGSFGGGKGAAISHGTISLVTLEDLSIRNIPVNILPLRQIDLAGMKIDGVIGTVFLSQFLSTIDYANGQLILRNKETHSMKSIKQTAGAITSIPFYMAGDHYMIARGHVNGNPMMLFVDTGLSNTTFACPKSTLKLLNVSLKKDERSSGQGGGGTLNIYPFDLTSLCLGDFCKDNPSGTYGAFPSGIENIFGFTINGLVSHRFFQNKNLTIDFTEMKYLVSE